MCLISLSFQPCGAGIPTRFKERPARATLEQLLPQPTLWRFPVRREQGQMRNCHPHLRHCKALGNKNEPSSSPQKRLGIPPWKYKKEKNLLLATLSGFSSIDRSCVQVESCFPETRDHMGFLSAKERRSRIEREGWDQERQLKALSPNAVGGIIITTI